MQWNAAFGRDFVRQSKSQGIENGAGRIVANSCPRFDGGWISRIEEAAFRRCNVEGERITLIVWYVGQQNAFERID